MFLYLCGKPRKYTALAWENIEANFMFLARLLISLPLGLIS